MATSIYFNNYKAKYNEQRLVDDLISESIKIQGFDAYYIPNDNAIARDLLYGEDPVKKFVSAFPVEMYLSSVMGSEGQKDFFSKFGLEIRNQVHVLVSRKAFNQRTPQTTYLRPLEGDLVYVPFLNGGGELNMLTKTKMVLHLDEKVHTTMSWKWKNSNTHKKLFLQVWQI